MYFKFWCAQLLSDVQLFATPWCILPGFSIHGIFQVRILEWVAISLSIKFWYTCETACHKGSTNSHPYLQSVKMLASPHSATIETNPVLKGCRSSWTQSNLLSQFFFFLLFLKCFNIHLCIYIYVYTIYILYCIL